jgi:hypothetical protein
MISEQIVYPHPNHIRSIFGPYSLPIDSDSVFVSAHYPLWFRIRKKYGNEYGFTTIHPYPLRFHPYCYLMFLISKVNHTGKQKIKTDSY